MSILHARFRTSRALWGSLSLVLFVLLGFLNLMPEAKGSVSYWQLWRIFLQRGVDLQHGGVRLEIRQNKCDGLLRLSSFFLDALS